MAIESVHNGISSLGDDCGRLVSAKLRGSGKYVFCMGKVGDDRLLLGWVSAALAGPR